LIVEIEPTSISPALICSSAARDILVFNDLFSFTLTSILSRPLLPTDASEDPSSATLRPSLVTFTASCVASWSELIIVEISAVALAALSARFLISSATTANARPASPARAASIDAFSEEGWFFRR
jgi:hypothetical protein